MAGEFFALLLFTPSLHTYLVYTTIKAENKKHRRQKGVGCAVQQRLAVVHITRYLASVVNDSIQYVYQVRCKGIILLCVDLSHACVCNEHSRFF